MAVLANRDIELSCDEAVLRQFGADSSAGYARTLIRMEERKSGFAPLGSHFSKNAIEERITAIMKIKKKSLTALVVSIALVASTVALFATSAKAETQGNDKSPQFTYIDTDECTIMSRGGPDGVTYYSLDDGQTWVEMTDEEFETAYGTQKIEWWTAEEYAAWLENEKKELQSIIGSKSWTNSTGWFTWTQDLVDETIVKYEQTLEDIQNGQRISKPIIDKDGGVLMAGYNSTDSFAVERDDTTIATEEENRQALLKEYEELGLTYDAAKNAMYWNGKQVRYFWDGVELEDGVATAYEHWDENGVMNLRTVREATTNGDGSVDPAGKLVDIREMTIDELETLNYAQGEINAEAEQTGEILAPYASLGLTHQTDPYGRLIMNWQGKRVRSLFDPEREIWVANSMGEGGLGPDAVDLEAVYENGKLTGLRQTERDFELIEAEVVDSDEFSEAKGNSTSTGVTLSERMKKFDPYGVTYKESDGKRVILYQGQLVGEFLDLQPDGSVFTVQSTEGGTIDLAAVYDSNGEFSGVEIVK